MSCSHHLLAVNSDVSSPSKSTDDWGWENVLWLGMGEQLRGGSWQPGVPLLPSVLQVILLPILGTVLCLLPRTQAYVSFQLIDFSQALNVSAIPYFSIYTTYLSKSKTPNLSIVIVIVYYWHFPNSYPPNKVTSTPYWASRPTRVCLTTSHLGSSPKAGTVTIARWQTARSKTTSSR